MSDFNSDMINDCPSGGVMLDIGANFGLYAVNMAQKAKQVFAFEPEPANLETLYENVKSFPNVFIVPKAVSNRTGTAHLMLNDLNRGGHSIHKDLDGARYGHSVQHSIIVETCTIDDWAEHYKIENIVGIKIDVEAHEQEVLEGALKTIKKNMPLIALETHDNCNLVEIGNILRKAGYSVPEALKKDSQYYFTPERVIEQPNIAH